jgi:hypothetical protein
LAIAASCGYLFMAIPTGALVGARILPDLPT